MAVNEEKCGTCGWVWERDGERVSDEENNAALNDRVAGMIADLWAAMPPAELAELQAALRLWAETGEVTGPLLQSPYQPAREPRVEP